MNHTDDITSFLVENPDILLVLRVGEGHDGETRIFLTLQRDRTGVNRNYSLDELEQYGYRLLLSNMLTDLGGASGYLSRGEDPWNQQTLW